MNYSTQTLAKLLSQEDLYVVESNSAKTASFNTETRMLVLPKTDNLSEGYVLHEIGHALYTPPVIGVEMLNKYGDLINVIEDNRIERKVKLKYPGSINKFSEMYVCLEDAITGGANVESMGLVDKLNVYSKSTKNHNFNFNEKEAEFAKKIDATLSFDDVIELSEEIYKYIKGNKLNQEEEENTKPKPNEQDQDDGYGESGSGDNSQEENSECDNSSEEPSNDNNQQEELKSETQEIIDNNINEIIEESLSIENKEIILEPSHIIEPNIKTFDDFFTDNDEGYYEQTLASTSKMTENVFKETTKISQYMATQFERKKRADELSRTQVSSKGSLNTRRLHMASFTDDIFNTVETLAEGKSHSIQMFIDFSGSMCDSLFDIIKQAVIITEFCQMVKIPFEIYGFTSSNYDYENEPPIITSNVNVPVIDDTCLYLISSHKNTKKQNLQSLRWMLICSNAYKERYEKWGYIFSRINNVRLKMTPLNNSLYWVNSIIDKFDNGSSQVNNVMIFTDGQDSSGFKSSGGAIGYDSSTSIDIVDSETRKTYKGIHRFTIQEVLFDVIKTRHNANISFVYMDEAKQLKSHIRSGRIKTKYPGKTITSFKTPCIKLDDNSVATNILMKLPKAPKVTINGENQPANKTSFKKKMKTNKDSIVLADILISEITQNFS